MNIASIDSIAAKAEKQFDDTGSLQGFSASCRSGSSEGVTGLSVSAIATADEDGMILAYTLDVNSAIGKARGTKHGLSIQQIEELMDLLSGLRGATQPNLPATRNALTAADAHA